MRSAFLYPAIENLRQGRLPWLFEQGKKFLIHKYFNKISPKKILPGPTMAILAVTYRCNSRCLMCDLKKRAKNQKEFTTKEWKNIIDGLVEIKTAGVGFTGGEPLLHPGICELMSYAKQKGLSVTISTNGLLLNNSNITKVLAAKPDNINISLDGNSAKTHDYLRNLPGAFEKTLKNTRNLIRQRNKTKSKTKITFITCVSDKNVNSLSEIAVLGAKIGVDKIGFLPLHNINPTCNQPLNSKSLSPLTRGRKRGGKSALIFLSQIQKIRKENKIKIDNSKGYLDMFPLAFSGKPFPIPCLAGETSITIDPFGKVFACWPYLELNYHALKLKTPNSLPMLWKSSKYALERKKMTSCRACFWNCHSELSIFYK